MNSPAEYFAKPEKNPLTILTIELEAGKFDNIEIYLDDQPILLAQQFIEKHQLDNKILNLLARNIQNAKEKALKEFVQNKMKASKSVSDVYPNIFSQNLPYFEYIMITI